MMNMPPMQKDVMGAQQSPQPTKSKWSLRNKGKQRRNMPMAMAKKDANYGARAGETIAGNLKRGADGKFSSGGGYQLSDEEKQALAARVAASHAKGGGKGKGKGGKKGGGKGKAAAKPKLTPEQKLAQQKQVQAKTLAALLPDDGTLEAVSNLAEDPKTKFNPEFEKKMLDAGLIQKLHDGSTVMTAAASAMLRAAARGDANAAKVALARAGEQAATALDRQTQALQKKDEQAKRKTEQQAKADERKKVAEQKKADRLKAAEEKKKGGGGKGGGGGGGKGQQKADPAQKRLENLGSNAEKYLGGDAAELLTAGDYPGDLKGANPEALKPLVDRGLAKINANGSAQLTGAGSALISAMQADNKQSIQRALDNATRRKDLENYRASKRSSSSTVKKEAQGFSVIKQANGLYRWVTFSSSSYYDRDGEVIPQAELEADVQRADATKEYGPLLWWHTPVRLGTCDFNDMVGRVLVESGTFRSEEVALAIKAAMPALGVSIGYEHAPVERGPGCVFKNIRRKERSLLPRGIESNRLTKVFVTGSDYENTNTQKDSTMKFEALKKLLGEKATKELIEEAQNAEKEAQAEGLAFKAKSNSAAAGGSAAADPNAAPTDATTKAPSVDPTAMTGGEPDGDETEGGVEDLPEGEPDGDEGKVMYVGDMAPVELHEMLDQLIQQKTQEALAPLKELLTSNQTAATKEVSNVTAAVRELVDLVKGVVGTNKEQAAEIETLKGQVATLTGELPRGFSSLKAVQNYGGAGGGAGRASQSQDNIVPPNSPLAAAVKAASNEDPYLKAASKMLAGFGAPAGQQQQQ